jgi:hypothetical protein
MKLVLTRTIDPESIILCSVSSFGNIGQMAIDCILATLSSSSSDRKLERIGHGFSEDLYPMTGYEELSSAFGRLLCLPLEGLEQKLNH